MYNPYSYITERAPQQYFVEEGMMEDKEAHLRETQWMREAEHGKSLKGTIYDPEAAASYVPRYGRDTPGYTVNEENDRRAREMMKEHQEELKAIDPKDIEKQASERLASMSFADKAKTINSERIQKIWTHTNKKTITDKDAKELYSTTIDLADFMSTVKGGKNSTDYVNSVKQLKEMKAIFTDWKLKTTSAVQMSKPISSQDKEKLMKLSKTIQESAENRLPNTTDFRANTAASRLAAAEQMTREWVSS